MSHRFSRYEDHPICQKLAPFFLGQWIQMDHLELMLAQSLPMMRDELGAVGAWLVEANRGRWATLSGLGNNEVGFPERLLSEALDSDSTQAESSWIASPLTRPCTDGRMLLVRFDQQAPTEHGVDSVAAMLGDAIGAMRERTNAKRRASRMAAILEIAASWQQTLEMEPLLQRMAEASTQLLGAERASIFLWDRPNQTLVGRPALGVDGNELRIRDNAGVVGRVLQEGRPLRVNVDEDQSQIDRKVDEQLQFETRSVLCVPLRAPQGALLGVFEVINKIAGEFTDDDETALVELADHAAIALANTQQHEQLVRTRNQITEQVAGAVRLIGQCAPIEALRSTIRRVADTDLAILVLGENGTGKEVVSQMIHYLSSRRHEPLVAVNCAAMTETLLESELFGHEKGAFTDARETRAGKFEQASGGTLFLDEIGDMSLGGQAKLLRVLEEKVVVRVGGSELIPTDTRVIAATNQSLVDMVRDRRFREDLYFRLNVVTLELPPLRERGDDILLLCEHFLRDLCLRARRPMPTLTSAAKKRLRGHGWPGNVRELRNLMERLAYLTSGDKIDADELAFILSPDTDPSQAFAWDLSLAEATRQFQVECIKKHVGRARGNMTEASKRLGLHRSNLYRKMRQLGMDVEEDESK